MDFSFLDSGLIPSLNESKNGNIVAHHALMGRSIPPSQPRPSVNTTALPPKAPRSTEESEDDDELTARPKDHISSIARLPDGGLKGLMKMRPKIPRRRSSMDGRISSIPPRVPPKPINKARTGPSANSAPEFQLGQVLHIPNTVKQERKAQHLSPPPQTARHARSSSWSAPLSAQQSLVPLSATSSGDPVRLLTALHLLIPPTRLDPLAPSPSTSNLHPPTLLSSLAFILEALVSERQILSSPTSQAEPLPLLRDKSSLQSRNHELDWNKMYLYLVSFGSVLEGLLGLLMEIEVNETVLGLIEMIKTYIEKSRKVFGEVAGLYMDRYTFMGGWWVEEGMRGSAKEVGRWSDLLART